MARLKGEQRIRFVGANGQWKQTLRLMAEAEGYVMVRSPGCAPFTMPAKDWRALQLAAPAPG